MDSRLLDDDVRGFVATVGGALRRLEPPPADPVGSATLEAFALVTGLLDHDGTWSEFEIRMVQDAFATAWKGHLEGSPADVRRSGVLRDRHAWLLTPSPIFDQVARHDAEHSTDLATIYLSKAADLAFAVIATFERPVERLLREAERWLHALRGHMRDVGAEITRAGPKPASSASTATSQTSDGPPPPPDLPPARPLEEVLDELNELVGLERVKEEVTLVTNLVRVRELRRSRGLQVPETSRHLIFAGNPGTGKTTVARIVAEIYRSLGAVEHGHLIETDRSGLVAGFVGQTATLVVDAFDAATGGILLIDEAYSLVRGGDNDFGREAIDTIVKQMEDKRDTVIVIAAGYPDEMDDFLDANPGLRSRFPKTIVFDDYSNDDLLKIFGLIAENNGYERTDAACEKILEWFEAQPRTKGFGNGRLARNLFEDAVGRHATRLSSIPDPTDVQLSTLSHDDIANTDQGPRHNDSTP